MIDKKTKLLIFVPAAFACLIDLLVTAVNQKPEYWQYYLHEAVEGNPILNWAMQNHVLGLFIVTMIWLIIISVICMFTPVKIGKIICLAIVIGNSWGAGTWISRYYGFWAVIVMVVVNSVIYSTFDGIQNRKTQFKIVP